MNNLHKINCLGTVAFVATAPYVQERFCYSFAQMAVYNSQVLEKRDLKIFYNKVAISWIPRGRNDFVNSMRGDWLFMLDADLEFDPDCLVEMLRIMNKYDAPVVTGLYTHKKKPYFPVLFSHNPKRKTYETIARWDGNPEIFQVDAAGAGCLLVKKFVFNMIREQLHQDPFDPEGKAGEDMTFFNRLRKIGVGVYCAPQVRFRHLTTEAKEYSDNFGKVKLTDPYQRDGA